VLLISYFNLAAGLTKIGKSAISNLQKALKIAQLYLGKDHDLTKQTEAKLKKCKNKELVQ